MVNPTNHIEPFCLYSKYMGNFLIFLPICLLYRSFLLLFTQVHHFEVNEITSYLQNIPRGQF